MDRFEPLSIEQQTPELKIKRTKMNKRSAKKRKAVSGITKKDRMELKIFEKKIIALNKKMNEQIKNKKSCKKQPLLKTLANAKKLGLTKRKRKGRKQPESTTVPVPEESIQEPVPEESVQEPIQEEPQPSVEPSNSTEEGEPKPTMIDSVTEGVTSAASSVSEAAESAAESVGLVKPAEDGEEKKEGGRPRKGKGKGKNSKHRR